MVSRNMSKHVSLPACGDNKITTKRDIKVQTIKYGGITFLSVNSIHMRNNIVVLFFSLLKRYKICYVLHVCPRYPPPPLNPTILDS